MTENNNGAPAPENEQPITPAAGTETPQSADDVRIGQIDTQLAALEAQKAEADTGSRRRAYQAEIDALKQEKSQLHLKPILDRETEQEQQEKAEPAPDFRKDGGYELAIPSYVPPSEVTEHAQGVVGEYSVLAKELSIPPDAAQQLLETFVDARLSLPPGMYPGSNPDECTAILRSTWGDQYAHNLKLVQDTARALGPKFIAWADRDLGDGSKLSNDPAFCQALLAHAKGHARLSPAQAQAALDKVMKDQKHPYWTGDKNAVADVKALRARVSGTAGTAKAQSAVKAPAPPTASQQIQTRINGLRTNPAYLDRSHASHKEVVAQVSALYAQLAATEGR